MAAAKRENREGRITVDAPASASALFADFATLSRTATMLMYRRQIGRAFDPNQLVKTDQMVAAGAEQRQAYDSLGRYFRGLLSATRPVFPHALPAAPSDHAAAAEKLLELRHRLWELEAEARAAVPTWEAAEGRAMTFAAVRELRTAGIKKTGAEDTSLDAMSDEAVAAGERAAKGARAAALAPINRALDLAIERLLLALALEKAPTPGASPATVAADDNDFGEYELAGEDHSRGGDGQIEALTALRRAAESAAALRPHVFALQLLLSRVRPGNNAKPLIEAVLWHSRKASGFLRDLHERLGDAAYPYGGQERTMRLSRYVVAAMPPAEQVGEVARAAGATVDAFHDLYLRLMADLAHRAEEVEAKLGLPPLEEPRESEAHAGADNRIAAEQNVSS